MINKQIRKTKTTFLLFFSLLITLIGCSNDNSYGSEEAIKRGDVVSLNDGVYNLDIFKDFLKSVSNHNKSSVRITHFTIEGDPIYIDLEFDGEKFKYRKDQLNDKNIGDNSEVNNDSCKDMEKKEEGEKVLFSLSGCDSVSNKTYPLISVQQSDVE